MKPAAAQSMKPAAAQIDLPWLQNINRPTQPKRIPAVLTQFEVAAVLAAL